MDPLALVLQIIFVIPLPFLILLRHVLAIFFSVWESCLVCIPQEHCIVLAGIELFVVYYKVLTVICSPTFFSSFLGRAVYQIFSFGMQSPLSLRQMR